jgi:hypothetical protein
VGDALAGVLAEGADPRGGGLAGFFADFEDAQAEFLAAGAAGGVEPGGGLVYGREDGPGGGAVRG